MAEAREQLRPATTVPRLPDCHDVGDCTCVPEEELGSERGAWGYLLSWLRVGWVVAPPRLLPARDQWLTIAYNVRGCLSDDVVTWSVGRNRLTAISSLGVFFEGGDDASCFRAQHRRFD